VRQLERGLAKVLRKVPSSSMRESGLSAHRGRDFQHTRCTWTRTPWSSTWAAPVHPGVAERTSVPGVATGLAVTGAGGDVLFIEATAMDGEPGLTLTGQLGDVMKESVSIALSYCARVGWPATWLSKKLHVHVPAGAVPKDGPSAASR